MFVTLLLGLFILTYKNVIIRMRERERFCLINESKNIFGFMSLILL